MAKDTKERILLAALEMFSRNGYAGTNIRELTASLGLGKSSMYRHFESKEEIWNALLDEMSAYYEQRFGSPEHMPPVPDSAEDLTAMTMRLVDFTVRDEKAVMTRKLLTIEQFRDDRARDLATKHFLTGLTKMFTGIFAGMMDRGLVRRDDPEMLAFAYTAPISALIRLCDREPDRTARAMEQAEAFSRHFMKVYGQCAPLPDPPKDPAGIVVRGLEEGETDQALRFVWRVFTEYESPDYGPEGTAEFRKCLDDRGWLAGIRYYGAFDGDTLAGVLGIREERRHIVFFFVDGAYQRRGIGTKLFRRVLEDNPGRTITLNAAPYGLPFYRKLGLRATDGEQTVNGIRFTPMEYAPGPDRAGDPLR